MREDVETELEYKYSKCLLEDYLNSESTVNTLGNEYVKSLKDFLLPGFFTHEMRFAFYLRKYLRHFNNYTNSCHEGTNNALKKVG